MIIDVSEHNGKLDWEKLKPQIEGAIIRCGFGSDYSKQDDAYYERNVSECERLGIPYGVYIYSYANTVIKARSEANHIKRLVEGHKPTLPLFYDLEEERYSSYGSKMANEWLKSMEGYNVGIYANVNWWKNYLTGVDCDTKWVAYWGKTKPSISGMVLWQYSDNGTVAGVSGFDLNENISLPIPSPAPTPTPTPAPTPEPTSGKAYIVRVNTVLNVRTGAGTDYKVVKQLPRNTKVTVYETSHGWGRIGNAQWVSMNYLVEGNYVVKVNTVLNVRQKPTTGSLIVGQLRNDTVVMISETCGNWGKIGVNKWVCMTYLV